MELMVVVGVPFGIVGARLYHVITDYQLYFGPGRHPLNALKIWEGGLGVWGAIAFGVLGGYLVARRRRIAFPAVLDAIAPAILVAQAIGRLGNWFNQELFGRPTTLPWALHIDLAHRVYPDIATYHPTFLYEFIYDLIGVAILLYVGKRFRIRPPGLFALYVAYYCFGRFFEELLRVDPSHHFLGLRINAWVSIVLFVLSTAFFIWWQFIRKDEPKPGDVGRPRRVEPTGPTMAVPKGRVR